MTRTSRRSGEPFKLQPRSVGRGLLILLGAAALAWAAATNAVANITADWNPALALRMAPHHPEALAARAGDLARQSRHSEAERTARAAISNSSTASAALVAIARLRSDSDPEQARRLFSYVLQLNRREVPAHLWLVQNTASGNVDEMLMHIDAAMRVSRESRQLLYPVLTALIADERALIPAIEAFSRRPSWLEGFFGYVIYNNGPIINLAKIVTAMPDEAIPRATNIRASLLRRLTQTENYSQARALYQEIAPERAAAVVRDPTFSNGGPYQPFDWDYSDGSDLRAVPVGTKSGGLQVYARTGGGGRVARQMVFLAPGLYNLATEADKLPSEEAGRSTWIARCVGTSEALAELPMVNGSAVNGHRLSFSVPDAGCPAQWVELYVRAGFEPEGYTAVIRNVSIQPVSNTPRQ